MDGKNTKRTYKYIKSAYQATSIAEGFEEASCREEIVEAWQYLHDTKLAYKLQGFFGRNAQDLMARGIILE